MPTGVFFFVPKNQTLVAGDLIVHPTETPADHFNQGDDPPGYNPICSQLKCICLLPEARYLELDFIQINPVFDH